jgi:AraC-like DNA-binding protein
VLSVALLLEIQYKYLFDYRMRLAVLYLLDSEMAINDIGIKLGYDYQSYFYTAFKRKYGVSPIEYRAMQHAQDAKHEDV